MTTNTLVLYAMWGTLSATVGAWVVALAKLIWQANEQAKMDVKVCQASGHSLCAAFNTVQTRWYSTVML